MFSCRELFFTRKEEGRRRSVENAENVENVENIEKQGLSVGEKRVSQNRSRRERERDSFDRYRGTRSTARSRRLRLTTGHALCRLATSARPHVSLRVEREPRRDEFLCGEASGSRPQEKTSTRWREDVDSRDPGVLTSLLSDGRRAGESLCRPDVVGALNGLTVRRPAPGKWLVKQSV